MSKVAEFVEKLDSEFAARESAMAEVLAEAEKVKKANALKARKLTQRDKALEEREAELMVREKECAKVENYVDLRARVDQDQRAVDALKERLGAQKEEMGHEANAVKKDLAELSKRELALSREKATYREKIKEEVLASVKVLGS